MDDTGSVYSTGQFKGLGDFDPGPGTCNLIASNGYPNAFVSKLDGDGNFVWANNIGGSGYYDAGYGLVLDNAGNVYATGSFQDAITFQTV